MAVLFLHDCPYIEKNIFLIWSAVLKKSSERYKKYYNCRKSILENKKNISCNNKHLRKTKTSNRQLLRAVIIFLITVLIAVVTIIISLNGKLNNKGKSVSVKEKTVEDDVNQIKQTKVDENTMIRVLIKTEDFKDIYHENVKISSDIGLIISVKDAPDKGEKTTDCAQVIEISDITDMFCDGLPLHIKTASDNSAIYLNSVKRSCGTPAYYGEFDIYKTEKGYVIINEVNIEKYICGVVPSEMPQSYGIEALKAQAVCARSYAARRLDSVAYPEYAAVVDDSVRYQVYNNYEVTEAVKEAVDDTKGLLAMYNGEIIDAYFYASSCGVTAGGEVWSESGGECEYLKAVELNEQNQSVDLSSENVFADYIDNENGDNYDSISGWYRWKISLNTDKLSDAFREEYGKINAINVVKRSSGGVVTELEICCEKKTKKLETEYDIREFFGKIIESGQNESGEISSKMNMLPSACFYVAEKKDNIITLRGGGYGHGVGMSQTGAKGMAAEGYDYLQILTTFYPQITVEKML